MTSHRHNTSSDVPADDSPRDARDAYLDAARECILDVGWRRTTLTEVARRSGVSRMTIYRAWSDMPALLGDLMTREWSMVVAGQTALPAPPMAAGPEMFADNICATIAALRDNELFTRIIELDPELVLPYLLARRGRSQEFILSVLAGAIETAQEGGAVRRGDPVALARGLVLAAHGFVLSAHTMADDRVDQAALDTELHTLIVRSLLP